MKLSTAFIVLAAIVILAACGAEPGPNETFEVPGGDPERGEQALVDYGCGGCHVLPGLPQASGTVGPPLSRWADRQFIAGKLPNTPANLIRWIQYPQAIEPGTAMPNMDVTEEEARDMSAYLYTLSDEGDIFSFLNLFGGE
jgi:cytochrome c1